MTTISTINKPFSLRRLSLNHHSLTLRANLPHGNQSSRPEFRGFRQFLACRQCLCPQAEPALCFGDQQQRFFDKKWLLCLSHGKGIGQCGMEMPGLEANAGALELKIGGAFERPGSGNAGIGRIAR